MIFGGGPVSSRGAGLGEGLDATGSVGVVRITRDAISRL
jgi:hypothetical protein